MEQITTYMNMSFDYNTYVYRREDGQALKIIYLYLNIK
jgi:hypothetical protein